MNTLEQKEYQRNKMREWRAKNPEKAKANNQEWYKNNKERHAAKGKLWKEANPEKIKKHMRKHDLKRHYGVTPEQYEQMYSAQGGLCLICGGASKPGTCLCIDHDHNSGKVRGLLCSECNTMLGKAKDSVVLLHRAIRYLSTDPDDSLTSSSL